MSTLAQGAASTASRPWEVGPSPNLDMKAHMTAGQVAARFGACDRSVGPMNMHLNPDGSTRWLCA